MMDAKLNDGANGGTDNAGDAEPDEKKRLPQLDAGDRNLERITRAALKILVAANDPPSIFRHADTVSRIRQADDGAIIVQLTSEVMVRNHLAKIIEWRIMRRKGPAAELPPKHVCENILADPEPPFPVLTRIVHSPIFAANGSLVFKPGYSRTAQVYYDPQPDFDVAPVPQKPEMEEVKFAREQIGDLISDFPFVADAEKAHAVALLLQPFARELIDGATPLYLIEKPAPGTGAGLLAHALTNIFLGKPAAVMSEGKDEDEWRKRITAKLVGDNVTVLIDNVRRRLESSALSAALTGGIWEDRVLGKTAIVRVPVKATWIATGNNPVLSNEIARRTVRIRLDSKVDRPWLRDGFRHPNLREYVAKERSKLAWCALVLIQDWIASGKTAGTKILGGFESWSKVIGGIMENAGFGGFLTNLEELYEQSDAEGKAWRQFVAAWWIKHGENEVGVSELFSIVYPSDGDPLEFDLGDKSEKSQKTRLGKMLAQMRDRQFDNKRIIRSGTFHGAQLWKLEKVGG